MSARRSKEDMLGVVLGLIVVGTVVVVLGVQGGALPWAILIAMATAVVAGWLTRELASAVSWSFAAFIGVLLLGAMALLSPGWYQPLLL